MPVFMTDLKKPLSAYKLKPSSKVMMIYTKQLATLESGHEESDENRLDGFKSDVDDLIPRLDELVLLVESFSIQVDVDNTATVKTETPSLQHNTNQTHTNTQPPTRKDLEFKARVVNELFLQILLKVDLIQDLNVRDKRKELVKYINSLLDKVDLLKTRISKL
jgi:BAG domain